MNSPFGFRGWHCVLPPDRVDLHDWAHRTGQPPDLTRALARSGLHCLRVAGGMSSGDLAQSALHQLITTHHIDPMAIDRLILVHTLQSSMAPPPDSLPEGLAIRFGLRRAACFSVQQLNCVSFFAALHLLAAEFRQDETMRQAIIVAADIMPFDGSRAIDDSGIHSDGAAALWIDRDWPRHRLLHVDCRLDGAAASGVGSATEALHAGRYFIESLRMIRALAAGAGLQVGDFSRILPHNLNLPGWRRIIAALDLPPARLHLRNFAEPGHVFCADPVINLDSAPDLPQGRPYLLYSNGFAGASGGAVMRA